jgi:hypothetical protein
MSDKIDVALLELAPLPPPFHNPDRPRNQTSLATFAICVAGVTVRNIRLIEGRDGKRWAVAPRCIDIDAEVHFSPALNRVLARMASAELAFRQPAFAASEATRAAETEPQ